MPGTLAGISIDTINGILVFKISGKLFGIDLDLLTTFINPRHEKPSFISLLIKENVIKYNDEILQLIDFHRFFGLELSPGEGNTQIISFEYEERKIAFYVDSIEEVISFSRQLRETARFIPAEKGKYSAGEFVLDNVSMIIPNIENMMADLAC